MKVLYTDCTVLYTNPNTKENHPPTNMFEHKTPHKESSCVTDKELSVNTVGAVQISSMKLDSTPLPPLPQTPKLSIKMKELSLEIDECICSVKCEEVCGPGRDIPVQGQGVVHLSNMKHRDTPTHHPPPGYHYK